MDQHSDMTGFFLNETASETTGEPPTFESNLIITVINTTFLVIGATGSLLTAFVIAKNKSLHTKANFFIFSLCMSDTLSALVCSPLWTYRRTWGFNLWMWGEFACKFYWVSDFATNYITSLHIVSFSLLRFTAIKWPFLVTKISKRATMLYICMLWLVAVVSALPLGYLMGIDEERANSSVGSCWPSCSIANKYENCCIPQYHTYISIMNPLMFYVPDSLIILFSVLIAYEIRKTLKWRKRYFASVRSYHHGSPVNRKNKSCNLTADDLCNTIPNMHAERVTPCNTICETLDTNSTANEGANSIRHQGNHAILRSTASATKEYNAFLQLFFIVLGYAIGYIPVTVYLQWSTSTPKQQKPHSVDYWFGVLSYMFLRLSECMNPLLYNLGSSTLRVASKKTVKKLFRCDP